MTNDGKGLPRAMTFITTATLRPRSGGKRSVNTNQEKAKEMAQVSQIAVGRYAGRFVRVTPAFFAVLLLATACVEQSARHYMDPPCKQVNESTRASPNFDNTECRIVNE